MYINLKCAVRFVVFFFTKSLRASTRNVLRLAILLSTPDVLELIFPVSFILDILSVVYNNDGFLFWVS